MDLEVELLVDETESDDWIVGFRDIKQASTRWHVRSLNVNFYVRSHGLLQKFKDEIGDCKVCYIVTLLLSFTSCHGLFKLLLLIFNSTDHIREYRRAQVFKTLC